MMAAVAPNPMWFASRGTGVAVLLLLTASTVIGILSGGRAKSQAWPRFVSAGWHRNLSLFAAAFLAVHVAMSVLDPFARIRWVDVIVPFAGTYRPLWLGLGVVSMELVAALLVTSAVRRRIGYRSWRLVHWLGYGSWPLALAHSLGTGTDVKAPWLLALGAASLVGVVLAVVWRLDVAPSLGPGRRLGGAVAVLGLAGLVVGWTIAGPLAPHWARVSGTPADLLAKGAATRTPVAAVAASAGPATARSVRADVVSLPDGSTRVAITDIADPRLQYVVRSAAAGEGSAVLAAVMDGRVGCVAAATVTPDLITATCGRSVLYIKLGRYAGAVGGTMWFGAAP